MWVIKLPLRVLVSANKQFALNLNQYRNTHFHVLNKAKEEFDTIAGPLLKGIPKLPCATLEYVLYVGSKQRCDVNNVCSVVDKFFSDSLVNHGILDDDNYNYIADTRFRFGGIDKIDPRIEVIIRNPNAVKDTIPMKIRTVITLSHDDMVSALAEYLTRNKVTLPSDSELKLELNGDNYIITFEDKAKKTKLEPKAAMEAVKAAYVAPTVSTVPVSETPVVTPSALVVAPVAVQTPVVSVAPEAPQKVEEPVPVPSKGASLFANFKRPNNG